MILFRDVGLDLRRKKIYLDKVDMILIIWFIFILGIVIGFWLLY